MRKTLQSMTLLLMLSFVFTGTGLAQEILLAPSTNPGAPPVEHKEDGGEWIKYWQDGINDNALGLGGDGAQWFAAIRWMPEDLGAYAGYQVTRIRVFMNDEPANAFAMVWQGDLDNPEVMVSQEFIPVEEDWAEAELLTPYTIDISQELWVGWEIGDMGDGNFPAAFEIPDDDAYAGLADLLQFGTNPWNFASALGFPAHWNIEAYVIPGDEPDPTYTVTFHVEDEDGNDIDNASIVLGPFEGGPGEYVFDGAPAGVHAYTVTAPGYLTVTGEVEVVDEDITVDIVMEETELEMYSVTFNVDMTGVEDFDYTEHHVFMTGTFTGWAEPGQEGSIQMELVENDGAKDAPPYTLYENFDDFEDFTTDLSPWITIQTTEGPTWGVGDFDFPGEGDEWAWMAFNPALTDPPIDEERPPIDGVRYGIAIQYMDFDDDKWLISPEVSINETSELSFWGRSHTHAYGAERIIVAVSTGGTDPMDFMPISDPPYIEVPTEWTEYTFDLSGYAGQTIHFAINYVSEDAFIFMIDAISLTADVDPDPDPDPDPDQLIYTATVDVPEGVAEYKYFSNAFGDGWAGGEWEGDPNREILVEGDMVVNDIWGDIPNSIVEVVEENIFSVYPNPASTVLNIRTNSQIQNVAVYDITGRIVLQQTEDVVNVSGLRNGLYIIQVNTTDGVESHRFHVVK